MPVPYAAVRLFPVTWMQARIDASMLVVAFLVDRSLVDRAKLGDAEAFDALARTVGERCMPVAHPILRDGDLARDAVQALLIVACRELRTLRDPDGFEPWLHRILTNERYAEARRRHGWSSNIRVLHLDVARRLTARTYPVGNRAWMWIGPPRHVLKAAGGASQFLAGRLGHVVAIGGVLTLRGEAPGMKRASQRDAVGHDRVTTVREVACAFAALVGAATVVAGCVALSAPATASGSSGVVAVPTASFPSVAPTALAPSPSPSLVAPTASPSPSALARSPSPSPQLPHADADLERYVPARIGAVELYRLSLAGPDIPAAGGDMCILLCGNEPREFAEALGIPLDRVAVALSIGERGGLGGVAFRAKGVATDRLAAAGSVIKGGVVGGGESFPMRVGERDVWFLYRLNRGQYLIPIGDVLVFLYGDPPTTAPGQISPAGTVPPGVVDLIRALPQ